jgi:hypothetical protein
VLAAPFIDFSKYLGTTTTRSKTFSLTDYPKPISLKRIFHGINTPDFTQGEVLLQNPSSNTPNPEARDQIPGSNPEQTKNIHWTNEEIVFPISTKP